MVRKLLFIFLGLMHVSFAMEGTMDAAYQEGKELGEGGNTLPNAGNISLMPGDMQAAVNNPQTRPPDLAALTHQATIEKDADADRLVHTPPEYIIDGDNDPLIKAADQIVDNPEGELKVQEVAGIDNPAHTVEHCVESSPLVERHCYVSNMPKHVGFDVEEKTFTVHISGLKIYRTPGAFDTICRTTKPVETHRSYFRRQEVYHEPDSPEVVSMIKQVLGDQDERTHEPLSINKEKIISSRYVGFAGGRMLYEKWGTKKKGGSVKGVVYHVFEIKTREEKPKYELIWESSCDDIDQEDCSLVEQRCIEGPATRLIEGVPISSSCWKKEMIFSCQSKGIDTCTPLRTKGCMQDSAACTQKDGEGHCREWQKTFFCPKGELTLQKSSLTGEKPFCLDGNCNDASYAPNQDMAEALSKMAVFDAMAGKLKMGEAEIFKGEAASCSREIANFKDCCRKRGWGMDIGLAGCTGADKELSEKRNKDLCVFVGSYCSHKVLGVCTQRRNTFCCFPNKMSRICQEQGRRQVPGMSWGTAEQPNCRGFTVEEIKRLDFGQIDLSELYQELQSKMKVPQGGQMAKTITQQRNWDAAKQSPEQTKEEMRSRPDGF